jgi:hypothetical protein
MNKNFLLFSICFGILIISSCQPRNKYPAGHQFDKFTSSIVINGNGAGKKSFVTDDKISVFAVNTGNKCFKFSGESESLYNFDYESGSSSNDAITGNFAIYPYSESNSISPEGAFSYTFPREQEALFSQPGPLVGFAADRNNALVFKNAFGFISMKVMGSGVVNAIKIIANSKEKISGIAKIDASSFDTLKVSMTGDSYSDLIMNYEKGVSIIGVGITFIIPIPPIRFSSGVTIEIYDNTGKYMQKNLSSTFSVNIDGVKQTEAFTYSADKGSECPVMDETILGVYSSTGAPLYQYSDNVDQISKTISSSSFTFKLLNTVYDKFVTIEDLPLNMVIGDTFTAKVVRYGVNEDIPKDALSFRVVKKSGNTYWLMETESSCYFIIEK